MFREIRNFFKIRALRGEGTRLVNFDETNHTFELRNFGYSAKVSFELTRFDNEIYVMLSGNSITSDPDCLTRIQLLLWNKEIPQNFSEDLIEQLKVQVMKGKRALRKDDQAAEGQTAENQAAKWQMVEEQTADGQTAEDQVAEGKTAEGQESEEQKIAFKIYFRDLFNYIRSAPNEIRMIIEVSRQIDVP